MKLKVVAPRRSKASRVKPSLHKRLSKIADQLERAPETGKKADKGFFDELSGH